MTETNTTTSIAFVDLNSQIGWGNTNVNIEMSPLSLIIGFILGVLFQKMMRG